MLTRSTAGRIGLVLAAAMLALVTACGGSDELLDEYGAAGAAQNRLEVTLDDFSIGGERAELGGEETVFRIRTHTDLVISVHNAGAVPHGLSLYADEGYTELLVASPEVPPGETAEMRFHFHDAQTAYLRDDRYPDQMRALLLVEAPEETKASVPVTVTYHDRAESDFNSVEYRPLRTAPALRLEQSDGTLFDLADRDGRVVVVMFGYATCTDVCPLIVGTYSAALRALDPGERELVDFVMVTVDPERESAGDVQAYLDKFDRGFIGLSGSPGDVVGMLDSWGVSRELLAAGPGAPAAVVGHSSSTLIVDASGGIRVRVPAHLGATELTADLQRLLAEP